MSGSPVLPTAGLEETVILELARSGQRAQMTSARRMLSCSGGVPCPMPYHQTPVRQRRSKSRDQMRMILAATK